MVRVRVRVPDCLDTRISIPEAEPEVCYTPICAQGVIDFLALFTIPLLSNVLFIKSS